MAYTKEADGIVSKGKTDVKVFGNSGPSVGVDKGKKGNGGKSDAEMLKMGRGMAKVANQKRG
jgi:hypothetical protein